MHHELRKEGTSVASPEILPKTLPRTSFKTAKRAGFDGIGASGIIRWVLPVSYRVVLRSIGDVDQSAQPC
jgi:hypothetical protein